jgi:hypothetical protein
MNRNEQTSTEAAAALPTGPAIVFVVDDDISVRESLELLIQSAGWQPERGEPFALSAQIKP